MSATDVMVFGQVKFEVAGTYFVEVLVDDVMKLRYPLPSSSHADAEQTANRRAGKTRA